MQITLKVSTLQRAKNFIESNAVIIVGVILSFISISAFLIYYQNGLGLSYNDARSHLDIGRRVVEGLKPGLAQLGSVWLPLPHILMIPTIWNDFFWHSGLAGALISMVSFVVVGILIYKFLEELGAGIFARLVGVLIFVANINILYLQSTAMTELLLMSTMTAGVYELLVWYKTDKIINLVAASFWIMLSTMVRYDGWFLFLIATILITYHTFVKKGAKAAEGIFFFFCTLGAFGIFLWLLWNQLIFKDALYFAFGPFSAHTQQAQMEQAGNLATKGNLVLSSQIYLYALIYATGAFSAFLGLLGAAALWMDRKLTLGLKIACLALLTPLLFNILALFAGHSAIFIQGLSGNTWFNVRYGVMMIPSIAIFIGFLIHKLKGLRFMILGLILFVTFFQFASSDAVTIDDARVGSSQKNVSEVSGWLKDNAKDKEGFVLISAASHDAIIFSSGLPMKKFIHEGTGGYWELATTRPEKWARWVVMRTHDENDLTFKAVSKTPYEHYYNLVGKYPFADIYELKPEFLPELNTKPILGRQK